MELSVQHLNGKKYYIFNNAKYYSGEIEIYFDDTKKIKVKGQIIKGLKEGQWTYFYENGNIERIEEYILGELNEEYKIYFETGEIKIKGSMKYDKMNGMWKSYYKNGNIQMESNYSMGKLSNGIVKEFYESGEIKSECPIRMGEVFGDYVLYDKEGRKVYKYFFRDGKKNGSEIMYDINGEEINKIEYVNGRIIK